MSIPLALAFMYPSWSAFNAGEIKGAGALKSQIVVAAEYLVSLRFYCTQVSLE